MADAPPDWKIDCLKFIRDTHGVAFDRFKTSKQDLIWIMDLERDGYIEAKFRMGYFVDGDKFADSSIPNLIWDIHILDKGREFIADFESPKTKILRDGGHDLLTYWRLAGWGERFGMVSVFVGVFIFGYLSASNHLLSRVISLIRDVTP